MTHFSNEQSTETANNQHEQGGLEKTENAHLVSENMDSPHPAESLAADVTDVRPDKVAELELTVSENLDSDNPDFSEDCQSFEEGGLYTIGCRVCQADGTKVSVVISKKDAESFCNLTDDANFNNKPELIRFVFNAEEARRVSRFLASVLGVEVFFRSLNADESIDAVAKLVERLLKEGAIVWPIDDSKDTDNLLSFNIEGQYSSSVQKEQIDDADDEFLNKYERFIEVTPTVKLDTVSTDTLFAEGSKSKRIFEILKAKLSPEKLLITVKGTTLARPVLTSANGHLISGLLDSMLADEKNLYVLSYPVEEEFDDEKVAFCLIAEARQMGKLPDDITEECMKVMYENLKPNTGKRQSKAGEVLNIAEHWSRYTGCSVPTGEREVTKARVAQGISQKKTPEGASPEDTQEIEHAVNRIILQVAGEMERFSDKTVYLQNRLRSRIKLRVAKLCKALKTSSKKSKERK